MSNMTVIKSFKPESLGKCYKVDTDGTLSKRAIANVSIGVTKNFQLSTEELAQLLSRACANSDLALM